MPRMKFDKRDFNVKELDVKYEGPQYERYKGKVPHTGTILRARVTKMWMTRSQGGDQQTRVLAIAEGNNGDRKEYNGLPIWEYLTWNKENSRRYMPFLINFDLTVQDVFSRMDVEVDDDSIGTPINSIADWEVGSDDALCEIAINRDMYDEQPRAKIDWDGWMPVDDDYEPDEDLDYEDHDDEEPPARPARSARSSSKAPAAAAKSRRREPEPEPDEYDDDDDEYDEDEWEEAEDEDEDDEPEPAPPARTRRSSSRPAARTSTTRRDGRRSTSGAGGRSSGSGSTSRSTSRGTSRSGTRDNKASASRATDRTRRTRGETQEPPF